MAGQAGLELWWSSRPCPRTPLDPIQWAAVHAASLLIEGQSVLIDVGEGRTLEAVVVRTDNSAYFWQKAINYKPQENVRGLPSGAVSVRFKSGKIERFKIPAMHDKELSKSRVELNWQSISWSALHDKYERVAPAKEQCSPSHSHADSCGSSSSLDYSSVFLVVVAALIWVSHI